MPSAHSFIIPLVVLVAVFPKTTNGQVADVRQRLHARRRHRPAECRRVYQPAFLEDERNLCFSERKPGRRWLEVHILPSLGRCHDGLLWINKPYLKGMAFISNQNWHNADLNLFWANIRANVQTSVDAFLQKQ